MPASHLRDVVVLMCAATLYQCGGPAKTTLHPASLPPLTPESMSVAAEVDSNSIELLELLAVRNEDMDLSKALGLATAHAAPAAGAVFG